MQSENALLRPFYAVPTRPYSSAPLPGDALSPGGGGAARSTDAPVDLCDRIARDRFGIDCLRPFQREAIDTLMRGAGAADRTSGAGAADRTSGAGAADRTSGAGAADRAYGAGASGGEGGRVLLVAPTGGGKSLCYQLPAVALPGTALVLSPLISLMEDQVRSLVARGVPATFIASTLSREEIGQRLGALRRGELKIVYAAPERLAFDGFLDALLESRLSLCAIDEAHCIVQWGHDFRPDYLRIGAALEKLRPPRAIACTATATPDAREEILRQLGWDSSRSKVILRGFARPNLHLCVLEVDGPRDATRIADEELREALGAPSSPAGAGIIYSATRKGAEKLAQDLRTAGWDAQPYHAGLAPEARAKVSAEFAARAISVVVATNAFGMGIDRPDVRLVLHAQPPSSIEAYYQEVGRAGRDGAPARGLLLLAGADIALRRRLCMMDDNGVIGSMNTEKAARAWSLFRELLRYVDAATCRHDFILRYFGAEEESLGGCGHCDVCLDVDKREATDPEALARDVDTIRRALAGVARVKGGAGMQAVAAMLVGSRTERVMRLGLDRLSTFGVLAGRPQEGALAILRALLANGWIDLSDSEFPVPQITRSGWQVMRGEQTVRVKLPVPRSAKRLKKRGSLNRPPGLAGASSAAASAGSDAPIALGKRDSILFEALRAHRATLAREKSVPPYVIAPDRTLIEIAALRPRSPEELRMAHGMGPGRVASYGDAILRIVRDHASPEEPWDG